MLNNKLYPIIFFDACSIAKIDYNFYGFKIPCFAWYLIEKSVGGAIATIGATRVAFTHVDDEGVHGGASYLNVHFIKAYELGVAISQMLVSAQNDYISNSEWKDCITLEEFFLVGDPSLKVGGYSSSHNLEMDNEKIIKSFPTLETIFDNTIFFYL